MLKLAESCNRKSTELGSHATTTIFMLHTTVVSGSRLNDRTMASECYCDIMPRFVHRAVETLVSRATSVLPVVLLIHNLNGFVNCHQSQVTLAQQRRA